MVKANCQREMSVGSIGFADDGPHNKAKSAVERLDETDARELEPARRLDDVLWAQIEVVDAMLVRVRERAQELPALHLPLSASRRRASSA